MLNAYVNRWIPQCQQHNQPPAHHRIHILRSATFRIVVGIYFLSRRIQFSSWFFYFFSLLYNHNVAVWIWRLGIPVPGLVSIEPVYVRSLVLCRCVCVWEPRFVRHIIFICSLLCCVRSSLLSCTILLIHCCWYFYHGSWVWRREKKDYTVSRLRARKPQKWSKQQNWIKKKMKKIKRNSYSYLL